MEPATVAIAALVISFLSVLGVFINCLITFKTYKKNRRLEFLQRRDHLAQKISDLNAKNAECHLIAARYEIVAVKKAFLPLRGEEAERMAEVIAALKRIRDRVEAGTKLWDENIRQLHLLYSNLTRPTDAARVELMIATVQAASDNLKNANDGFLSSLHILETNSELLKTTLAETDAKIRQINLAFERDIAKLRKERPDSETPEG